MLVLTRKINESIVVNKNVIVTVIGVKGNIVRLGVTAPMDVPVDREEVHHRRHAHDDDDLEAELKELQGDKPATS